MNALVKKEIRLLLPNLLIGCALALANLMFRFNPDGSLTDAWWFVLAFVCCGAMAVMLALNSFGAEISAGTFSNLLTQPIARQRIWQTKALLLGAALLIFGLFWSGCGLIRLLMLGRDLNLGDLITGVGTFGLVVFSGGLWTVLLLRQVAAAFWFTLLTPGAIWVLVAGLWPDKYAAALEPAVITVLLLYSLAGFWFARRLFLRAQDVAWTGGTIAMPEMRGLARFKLNSGARRWWRPRAALWRKEFALQQAQFVMAFALLVLHLGVLAVRKTGSFQRNSTTELILEVFWGLWLVLPLLVGAAAVAEERKLGTLALNLCQPVKRRAQFEIKFCTVLLLSALFGIVVPFGLEGSRILPNISVFANLSDYLDNYWEPVNATIVLFWYGMTAFNSLLPVLALLSVAITIGAISFYVSTLARNTLQALAPAVLGFVCFVGLLVGAFRAELLFHYPIWHGLLVYILGLPILAVVFLALSFRNWQHPEIGSKTFWRNFAGWVAALACIMLATTAIYHRTWEKLTAFEPAHGPARLSLSNPPVLGSDRNSFSVQLPDGRAWINYLEPEAYQSPLNLLSVLLGNLRLTNTSVRSFAGTNNFVNEVRAVEQQSAGIKADGTLWVWEPVATMVQTEAEKRNVHKEMKLVRFGTETNWSSLAVAPHELALLLVKEDGTLWRWGVTNVTWDSHTNWPGLRSFPPQRLGAESNWAEVFEANNQTFLRKTDGTIWTTGIDHGKGQLKITLEPRFTVECPTVWGRAKWRSQTASLNDSRSQLVVVDEEGSFRIVEEARYYLGDTSVPKPTNLLLGNETNWLAVAGIGEYVVTLKNDGTLWVWNFDADESRGGDRERDEQSLQHQTPVRLGSHADWVGVTSMDGGIVSLAADGSLWYWPLESVVHFMGYYGNAFYSYFQFEPLLDVSRKPQSLGNLFGVKAGQPVTAMQ